jgi:hypothetical protein
LWQARHADETTDAEWQVPSRVITLDDLTTSTVSVGLRIDL